MSLAPDAHINKTSFTQRLVASTRKKWYILCLLLLAAWAMLPAIRAFTLIANIAHRTIPNTSTTGMPTQEVRFQTTDGTHFAGWFVMASPQAPTIILVHGFKGTRVDMLPWAHFLYNAGYNVLLYDSRGCGESEGLTITLGAREPDDVVGAVNYLKTRTDLRVKRFGALGISLGAGIVILAAAKEPALAATVADSAWADESAQIDRMGAIGRAPFILPVLPYEPALVNWLIGAHLEDTRPLTVIHQIAPRAVMLIHSADDSNTTTPPSGERQLYAAAGAPKVQWIAPHGNHVGAIKAYKNEYEQRVLAFFGRYLKN